MRRATLGIATLAMAAVATSVHAQSTNAPAPPSEDIVVTGTNAKPHEIQKAALAITAPGNLYREPLARFEVPVCPAVAGIDGQVAAAIVDRIRLVAGQAAIRVAQPGKCAVNLLVLFLPNGQSAMRNLLHGGPWLFGPHLVPRDLQDLADDPVLKELAADPGPVHAWVNTQDYGRDGQVLTGRDIPGEPKLLKTAGGHSHIFVAARREIMGSVVVIDGAAVEDMTVGQIADYAAMRGLARTRPPRATGSVGTILTLFDKSAVAPIEATSFDHAYLRAVYSAVANLPGITKVGRVAYEARKAANRE